MLTVLLIYSLLLPFVRAPGWDSVIITIVCHLYRLYRRGLLSTFFWTEACDIRHVLLMRNSITILESSELLYLVTSQVRDIINSAESLVFRSYISDYADHVEFPDSLAIHPYHPSFLSGHLGCILCSYWADLSLCWSASTGRSIHRIHSEVHPYNFRSAPRVLFVLLELFEMEVKWRYSYIVCYLLYIYIYTYIYVFIEFSRSGPNWVNFYCTYASMLSR